MNNFLNTSWISMEVLRLFINGLEVAEQFNTDYDKDFKQDFAVGSTITVKYPQKFLVRDGLAYNPQSINRKSTTVSLDQIFGIDFEWDSYEKAVKMERSEGELQREYLYPAAMQLANELDSRAALWAYQNTNKIAAGGVLGTDPTTVNPYLAAERYLFEKACPAGDRKLIVSGAMQASLVQNLTTIFNPSSEISRQYKKGTMGTALGWDWYRSNNLYSHTAGTWAGAVTVTGAGQSGGSLIITGTVNDTLKKGDKFSIANVNQVNPMSRRLIGGAQVQHFTVLQDYTLTGGADTINISPALELPGSQYQNVDAAPANGAALTLWPGTAAPSGKVGTVGLGLSKFAFAVVGAVFEEPTKVEVCSQKKDPQTGLDVRFIRQFVGDKSLMINRFDMCVGFGNLYPDQGAVTIPGA